MKIHTVSQLLASVYGLVSSSTHKKKKSILISLPYYPKGYLTSVTASALPHATDVAVYTALFLLSLCIGYLFSPVAVRFSQVFFFRCFRNFISVMIIFILPDFLNFSSRSSKNHRKIYIRQWPFFTCLIQTCKKGAFMTNTC